MTRSPKLALALAVVGYLLVVFQGVLRLTGADDSCRTAWPVCRAALVSPSLSVTSLVEYGFGLLVVLAFGLSLALLWLNRSTRLAALPGLGLVLLLIQGVVVALDAAPDAAFPVITHVGLSEAFLGLAVALLLLTLAPRLRAALARPAGSGGTALGRTALLAALLLFCLSLTGSYASISGDGCSEWPLCDGRFVPGGTSPLDLALLHRWLAVLATVAIVALVLQARRLRADVPGLVGLANATVVLMLAQIFVGAANIWFNLNPSVGAAHLGVATILWVLAVGIAVLDRLIPAGAGQPSRPPLIPLRQIWRDYVVLTKPGVMSLLLITTLGAMLIAQAGLPPLRILVWTLIGGALASGGAAALNHYYDRDIDAIMSRTRGRPLPGGRIPPIYVPIFGVTLSVLAVYVLAVFVNPLAAMLSLAGNLFYVCVYTMWLKRTTPQNIVIGGAAGSVPPLVGWAAVTNQVTVPALLLFALIFYWTPPHFWALALFKSTDYAAAGVPMFPEVYGEARTRRHIFGYTLLMVLVSLVFFPLGVMGPFYLACALLLGGVFLYKSYVLLRLPANDNALARALFFYSIRYLGLIFLAMVLDRLIWF